MPAETKGPTLSGMESSTDRAPEVDLQVYLAVAVVPGMMPDDLGSIQLALTGSTARVTSTDRPISFHQSYLLPALDRWVGVFSASDPSQVQRALAVAHLRAVEITPAVAHPNHAAPRQSASPQRGSNDHDR